MERGAISRVWHSRVSAMFILLVLALFFVPANSSLDDGENYARQVRKNVGGTIMNYCIFIDKLKDGEKHTYYYLTKESVVQGCGYSGYVPAGRPVEIKDIEYTEMGGVEQDMMSKVFKTAGDLTDLGSAIFGGVPILGNMLGIMSTAFSMAQDASDTPGDVINKVNDKMIDLTTKLNDRLTDLVRYVDNGDIEVHRKIVEEMYSKYWIKWTVCSVDRVRRRGDCLVDTELDIYSSKLSYMQVYTNVNNNNELTVTEVKELEAFLPHFRSFVNMHFIVLKALILLYENDDSDLGLELYQRYSDYIYKRADEYTDYANNAIRKLKAFHKNQGFNACKKSIKLKAAEEKYEGRERTGYDVKAECQVDDINEQKCHINTFIWWLWESHPPKSISFIKTWDERYTRLYCDIYKDKYCGTPQQAALYHNLVELTQATAEYGTKHMPLVEVYWLIEVERFVPIWAAAKKLGIPGKDIDVPELKKKAKAKKAKKAKEKKSKKEKKKTDQYYL